MLDELDGTPLVATFPGNRLRKFFTRDQLRYDRAEQLELLQSPLEMQAHSSNPDRLQELLGMIEDARNNGVGRDDAGADVVEEGVDGSEDDGEGDGNG
jgi:hypothetical protein